MGEIEMEEFEQIQKLEPPSNSQRWLALMCIAGSLSRYPERSEPMYHHLEQAGGEVGQ